MIPGLGRSPGEGKGYPLQYSGLENSMDCILQGVAKSGTRLSDFHFRFFDDGHSDWCEVIVHVVLICVSLITSDAEHLFNMPTGHLYVFSGEMSI